MKGKSITLAVFTIVFITGIIFLVNSLNYGQNEMSEIMQAHGGSMDTNQYLIFLEQSISKFRYLGSILALLGGAGVLQALKS